MDNRSIDQIADTVSSLKRAYAAAPSLLSQSRERHKNPAHVPNLWSGNCHTFTFPDREITFGFADEGVAGNGTPYDLMVTMGERFYQIDLAHTPQTTLDLLPTLPADVIRLHLCQPSS